MYTDHICVMHIIDKVKNKNELILKWEKLTHFYFYIKVLLLISEYCLKFNLSLICFPRVFYK